MAKIYGNTVGAGGGLPKSYVLETEDGVTLTGVLVDEVTVFDAEDNDVREGKTYASDKGVSVGTKFIPSYVVTEKTTYIPNGREFAIKLPGSGLYDYTKLQAIICPFNTSIANSVGCEKVAINNYLYDAMSVTPIATLTVDFDNEQIKFGISNSYGQPYIVRLFTYKEIY